MLCIPKIPATKLINSLRGDGISKLQAMTSTERREFFASIIGKELAQKVNAEFERAMVKNTKSALADFAKKIVGTYGAKKKDIPARIAKLDEKGLLDGNILEDYVSEFLGAKITKEEVSSVRKVGMKLAETEKKFESEFSKVQSSGEITDSFTQSLVDYGKALRASDELLLTQSSTDWSSTIWNNAKAGMLFNPASWNVNIISNAIQGITTMIERRVRTMRVTGYNPDLATSWRKTMIKVRKETGYDLSRALSLDDMMEKKIIGEKMSIGRDNVFTNFIYNDALGGPDAWAGRLAFADSLDLESSLMANAMGLKGRVAKEKAREIFVDAMRVAPVTEEGKIARKIAVQDAMVATWTNKGVISSATLKLKSGLNRFAEDGLGLKGFKLGDMIEPFVKTPANIAQYGLDASGLGIIRGAGKFSSLVRNYKVLTDVQRKRLLGESLSDSMRTGLGVGGGLILASFIDEDNFMGAYDPNRHKYEQLRNSNYNAIRIGDKWYSLDYTGGFAAPLIAILYAKKYGEGSPAKMLSKYAVGVADQTSNIPFVGSLKDIAVKMNQAVDPDSPESGKKIREAVYDIFNNQITSRVPGLLINIAKLYDTKEREATGFMETLQSKLPYFRNRLIEKQDMFGQEILTEAGLNQNGTDKYIAMITQVLAGARIKTAKDTSHGNEIRRLKSSGNGASLTSWKYRLGERQQRLKDMVGDDEYRRIYKEEYGKKMIEGINKKLSEERYKKLSDADKKKEIDRLNDRVMDSIYSKHKVPLRK